MKKRLLTVLIITSILLGTGCGGIGNVKFKSGSYSRSADYMGIFDTEECSIVNNLDTICNEKFSGTKYYAI